MICSIDGCQKDIAYHERAICQMHYFRFMRNGSYDKKDKHERKKPQRNRKPRTQNKKGYQMLDMPLHKLAMKNGYVYEHRAKVYDRMGENLKECELCGKSVNWKTVHIDHIDRDVKNNSDENLRPLCRWCNVSRDAKPSHMHERNHSITYKDRTMTLREWSRQPDVKVSNYGILCRLKKGMSIHDSLFSEKKTHNGKGKK